MTFPKVVANETGLVSKNPLIYEVCVEANTIADAGLYIGNFYGPSFNVRFMFTHNDNPKRHVFKVQLAGFPARAAKRPATRRLGALATVLAALEWGY